MKRRRLFIIFLIVGFLLSACSQKDQTVESSEELIIEPAEEPTVEPVLSGACGVSYFPILPDTTWVYRMAEENGLFVENRVWYEEITDDSFVWMQEIDSDPPVSAQSGWTCTEEGLISTDFAATNVPAVLGSMGYDYDYDIETLEFSGITFPAEEMWYVDSEWTSLWKVAGDINVEDLGLVNAVIDITMNNLIAAEEPISVPAGNYDKAMRVDSIMQLDISIKMEGLDIPSIQGEYGMSSWYVQGVGLVKQVSEDASFSIELSSME
ncbi:MAG TPA: hypothetical protein DCK95_09095 [Anaerolineaceae bacterium]|nr:hypothetical protein [Anaerolineaceae bacterium]